MQTLNEMFSTLANPLQASQELPDLFAGLENHPAQMLQTAYREILRHFALPEDSAFAQAGREIAALIDAPNEAAPNFAGNGNGYHNKNHMLEVMIATAALLEVHEKENRVPAFSDADKLTLITAALSHDIGHNGKSNGTGANRSPMLLEKYAIALAEPIIRQNFTPQPEKFERSFRRFAALIAATDIGGGPASPGKFFAEAAKFHRGERNAFPPTPAPELEEFSAPLQQDVELAEMSCLLQDADLFSSIGLTSSWAEKQNARMGAEDPSRLTPSGDVNWTGALWFYNNLAEFKSQAGRNFAPSLEAIKSYAVAMEKKQRVATPA